MGNKNANSKETDNPLNHNTQNNHKSSKQCMNTQTAGWSQRKILTNRNSTGTNDFNGASDNRIDDESLIKCFPADSNYHCNDIIQTTTKNNKQTTNNITQTNNNNIKNYHNVEYDINNCKENEMQNGFSSKSFSSSKTAVLFTPINYMKRMLSIRKRGKEDRGKDSSSLSPPLISLLNHHHHHADDVNGVARDQLNAAKHNVSFKELVNNTTSTNNGDKTKMDTGSCTHRTSNQRRSSSRTQLIEGGVDDDDDGCGEVLDDESSVFNHIVASSNHGLPLRSELIEKSVLENCNFGSEGGYKGREMTKESPFDGHDIGRWVTNIRNHLKTSDMFDAIAPVRSKISSDLCGMENFPPTLNLELKAKSKIKIRTNPWIAQSTGVTPLSSPLFVSPQITHTYPNTPIHENSLKTNLSKKSDSQGQTLSVEHEVLRGGQTLESNPTNSEEDMNSSSEGYYTSSMGSLSRCSLDSPESGSKKSTKFVKETTNDSGYFATFNSEASHFSAAEENMAFALMTVADSKTDEDGEWKVPDLSADDTDMLLPCSSDLIAINKLLRMNYIEKELLLIAADAVNLNSRQFSPTYVQSDSQIINRQVDNPIFDFEKNFDDDVFENILNTNADDLEQNPVLVPKSSSLVLRESSQSDGSTTTGDVDEKKPRGLNEICHSVEANFKCLNLQRKKIKVAVESIKWKEKIKKENLKMLREKSIENKKEFLLSTLNRLKQCLDQQKSWLQQAYDEILQKKWPSLHHSKA